MNLQKLADAASSAVKDNRLILKESLMESHGNVNIIDIEFNCNFYNQTNDHQFSDQNLNKSKFEDTCNCNSKATSSSIGSNSVDFDAIVQQSSPPANMLRQTWLLFNRNLIIARRNYVRICFFLELIKF